MGFFQNVKDKLGIGGVKVTLQVPGQVAKDSGFVTGVITLTTKSEQEVKEINVKLIEEFSTGKGQDKKTKEFELGFLKFSAAFTIVPGETKEIPFSLPFSVVKSNNDHLKDKGGVLGALGKVGAFAANERSEFIVKAVADVKSAALDPSDSKEIQLV